MKRFFLNIIQGSDGYSDGDIFLSTEQLPKGFEITSRESELVVALEGGFWPTEKGLKKQVAFLLLKRRNEQWTIAEKSFSGHGQSDFGSLTKTHDAIAEASKQVIPDLRDRVARVNCDVLHPPRQTIQTPKNPISWRDLEKLATKKKKKEIIVKGITPDRNNGNVSVVQLINIEVGQLAQMNVATPRQNLKP